MGRRFFGLFGFFCLLFCFGLEVGLDDGVFPRSVITYAHSTARGQTPIDARGGARSARAREAREILCSLWRCEGLFLVSGERAERASPRR